MTQLFALLIFVFVFSRVLLTITLFLARGIIAGVFQAIYVYTPEVIFSNCDILLSCILFFFYIIIVIGLSNAIEINRRRNLQCYGPPRCYGYTICCTGMPDSQNTILSLRCSGTPLNKK